MDRQMDAFHGEGILQSKHFTTADIAEEGIDGDGHRILVHSGASTQSPSFVCLLSSCTNWAAQWLQYLPNDQWNMSKMLYKIS